MADNIRKSDIYEQYKRALIDVNNFYYERTKGLYPFKYRDAQKSVSFLGCMANHFLLESAGRGSSEKDRETLDEVNKLIADQKRFTTTQIPEKGDLQTFFEEQKSVALKIMDGYDRRIVKWGLDD